MAEPLPELETALQHVSVDWDQARSTRGLDALERARVQRRTRAWALGSVAALCVLGSASWIWLGSRPNTELNAGLNAGLNAELVNAGWRSALAFADGSRAFVRDDDSQVLVARVSPALTEVTLTRGRARFDVAHRPERRFRVVAGDLVVQVLGTAFEVARSAQGTHVAVSRGRVAVNWPGGRCELSAGEARWFASSAPAQTAMRSAGTRPSPTQLDDSNDSNDSNDSDEEVALDEQPEPSDGSRASSTKSARSGSTPSWRQHAEQGDFNRAFALLQSARAPVADDVEELLLAADSARLSGHATQSLPFLHKVVDLHARDPRAPLAAFTLGGVLLNQLGRPREAQAAYAHARTLAPRGSLAQDALAREVEAAHRGDDPAAARALALEYLERYPDGRRVQAVRRFGGLP